VWTVVEVAARACTISAFQSGAPYLVAYPERADPQRMAGFLAPAPLLAEPSTGLAQARGLL